MNTSFLAMGLAAILTLGLLLGVAALSLLSGALTFLFARPRIQILKSENEETGFAFSFYCGTASSKDTFDQVRLRLFNPFGKPDQVDLYTTYSPSRGQFAQDVDMGPAYRELIKAKDADKATVQIEVSNRKGGTTFDKLMPVKKFFQERDRSKVSVQEFNDQNGSGTTAKPYYHIPKRDFIAPPIPQTNKVLKLATNPEFAGDFSPDAAAAGAGKEDNNFAVSKVWIDPGCIVCDACEAIYPEVFEVLEDTCVIRPDAPLHDGLRIEEAAEACPVEVIKFTRA